MMHVDRLGYGNSGLFSNYNSCGNVAFEHMCKVNFYFLPGVLGIFLKKRANTDLFFVYFRSFQTNIITIFTTNICENCPSSIVWCRDSNPLPSEHESLPITTRLGQFKVFSFSFRTKWSRKSNSRKINHFNHLFLPTIKLRVKQILTA